MRQGQARAATLAAALTVLTVASVFAAGGLEETGGGAAAEIIVMNIGHAQPVSHPRHKSLLKFKELVEERSGGAIVVRIFPAAQLGDEAAMQDAVRAGELQGTRGGLFERVSSRLLVYTLPFLFDNLNGIEKVTMGPIGDWIAADAKNNGLLVLTTGDAGGFRQITNNTRPIVRPDDLRGLVIRTPGVRTIDKTMEAFGAAVVQLPYGDTYAALKNGVANGQENPFINIEAMKFYEVQKYLTLLDYQFHPDPFIVNPAWYEALSTEQQRVLKQCAEESMRYNNELVRTEAVRAYEVIKNAMLVTVLSPEERQAFKDRAQQVYDYFIAEEITTREEIEEIKRIGG